MNLKKKFPEKLAQLSLKKITEFLIEKKIILKKQQILINIANVSEKEIQTLNAQYRNKNEATDILSFSYNFNAKKLEGDLIVCWKIIQKNAQEIGIEAEQELVKNLAHGCLHLTGREHSDEMFTLQDEFLQKTFPGDFNQSLNQ